MDNRLKSAFATAVIQGLLGYSLIMGLAMSVPQRPHDRLTTVDLAPEHAPPPRSPRRPPTLAPKAPPIHAVAAPAIGQAVALHDWATASPEQRNLDFIKNTQWVKDNLISKADRRLAGWHAQLPQGTGPARVVRLRPNNLPTHTLYWPPKWSKGLLPIIAWGNGYDGMCSNSSLPYAAFLSEIASHGYFVVAVGNDDIDYPQPEGLEILADGRPIRTQATALRKAIDWAIAENGRASSPYARKLDPSRIAYMGHGCGGEQAMEASSDPRTTTTVLLNSAATFTANAPEAHKPSIAHFEGSQDESAVLDVGEVNFTKAQAASWPMYKAALNGMSHNAAYAGPDRRWSKAVLAWLDWQLKGDGKAMTALNSLSREGWSRVEATGLPSTATVLASPRR